MSAVYVEAASSQLASLHSVFPGLQSHQATWSASQAHIYRSYFEATQTPSENILLPAALLQANLVKHKPRQPDAEYIVMSSSSLRPSTHAKQRGGPTRTRPVGPNPRKCRSRLPNTMQSTTVFGRRPSQNPGPRHRSVKEEEGS